MILFILVLTKILLSFFILGFLYCLLFFVVLKFIIFVFDNFWVASHLDVDEELLWREDDYTFAGPFLF